MSLKAMKKPMVVLTGPTAAGKTDLSLNLAERIGGEIISADSMQVYRGMDIGTAKIRPGEMRGIPHHLIDVLDPSEPFNVMIFRQMALETAESIWKRGRIPILVGGTGFYIQAILYDVDFSDQEAGGPYRKYLQDLAREKGSHYLHDRLKAKDPEYAAGVHANNVKRVIRALEFYHETGEKLSAHNSVMRKKESPWNFACFVLYHDREILYERINRRVDIMMEAGLLSEVTDLYKKGYDRNLTSMQGIGYKEFFDYFEGKADLSEVADRIKKNTRHFAKRQMTWFRREKDTIFINKDEYGHDGHDREEEILEMMLGILREKGIIQNFF